VSGSRSEIALAENKKVLRGIVRELQAGDEIVLLRMEEEGLESGNWSQRKLPKPRTPGKPTATERRILDGTRDDIERFVQKEFTRLSSAKTLHTDIFSTLFKVADFIRDDARPTALVLLSDMIHDSQGRSFERLAQVPSPEWIARQREKGLVPDLRGVCVTAVGPDASTAKGVRIRAFWENYFRTAGADLSGERYRQIVPDTAVLSCGFN
jgi:hypothetical protein